MGFKIKVLGFLSLFATLTAFEKSIKNLPLADILAEKNNATS